MEKEKKTKIVAGFFMAISVVSAFFFWRTTGQITQTLNFESWIMPMIFFSVLFIFWSLGIILAKDDFWIRASSFLIIFLGANFSLNWKYLLVIAISAVFLLIANSHTNKEVNLRTEISIWNSLRIGRRFFIMAIALILAGQYYFGHSRDGENKNIPQIKIGEEHAWLATRVMSAIDPELTTKEMETLTIDDFILRKTDLNLKEKIQPTENIPDGNVIPNGLMGNLTSGINIEQLEKDVVLEENRKNIEGIVRKDVQGNEKMVDIISEIINSQANEIFSSIMQDRGTSSIIMAILALALFLAIVSLGTFVSPVLIFISWILFKLLILFRLITIEKRETFMEVII